MDNKMEKVIADTKTLTFIKEHRDSDVRILAFKRTEGVNMPFALEQIAGFQKARKKLPLWSQTDGILFPPSISMEQCSSEQTALYKTSLLGNVRKEKNTRTGSMMDLTGGFGVDFSYLAKIFSKATYIERQEHLCAIAEHNFQTLGLSHAKVVCADSEEYLKSMQPVDVIYIDPARRDNNGGRTFAITDCSPDVLHLLPVLLEKAKLIMIKLSPMLDWHKAVADFNGHVKEVHIVAVDNECKELLLIITPETTNEPKVFCVNNDVVFSPNIYNIMCSTKTLDTNTVSGFLLVPNAAIMKAGCFAQVAEVFGVTQISDNSHIFISESPKSNFPGNTYRIITVTTMNKKELKAALKDIKQANIAARNFPLSADELRKRLKMKDGGKTFIFATTLCDSSHVLIICESFRPSEPEI